MTTKEFITANLRFPTKREFYLGLTLAGLCAFFFGRGCQKKHDAATASTILAPDVKEKIVIDPRKHTVVIVTREGTKATTLPDRPSSIEIHNDGKVIVTSPQWGIELDPFLGAAFSLHGGLLGAGTDFFYWKKADVGLGFMINPSNVLDTGVFLAVSYRVWSNTSLALGIDNHTTPLLLIKVRL